MYTLTNCTPHVMFLARELVPDPLLTLRGRGQYSVIDGHAVIALAPSGFTLPALAVAAGPDLAARVTYEATDKMREELRDLRLRAHSENPSTDHLLICSQISAEAAQQANPDLLYDGVVMLRCRTPVFAAECARNPPDQRWADRLAICGDREETRYSVVIGRCGACGQMRTILGGRPQLHPMGGGAKGMCNQ